MTGQRFTAEDVGMEPQQQQPSYMDEFQKQGQTQQQGQTGGGISQYTSTLREINQLLQQLNQMGVLNTQQMGQNAGMGGQMGQQVQNQQQNQGQTPTQGQQNQQEPQGQNIEHQAQQLLNQFNSGIQMLQQEPELGPDATLEDAQSYIRENEGDLLEAIEQLIKQQQGGGMP